MSYRRGSGDDGYSQLIGSTRYPKNDVRFRAIGAIDELNASIGMLICLIETSCKVSSDV